MSLNPAETPAETPANEPLLPVEQPSPPPILRKRKKQQPKNKTPQEKIFNQVGAQFARSFSMNTRPGDAFSRRWYQAHATVGSVLSNPYEEESRISDGKALSYLLENSPAFAAMVAMDVTFEEVQEICAWLNDGSTTARNSDTGTVKKALWSSFGLKPPYKLGVLPFTGDISKPEGRGYNSDETGRLLTPHNMSWDNLKDSAVLKMPASTLEPDKVWFRFLYPGAICNPADEKENLMRGEVFWKAYYRLFSFQGSRNMRVRPSVTIHRVAYVICLVHNALSDAPKMNSDFSQAMYYERVCTFLSADENSGFWEQLKA